MPKADDKELVQVLFDKREFQMIEKLATADGEKVAHWVRDAARMRLGVTVIDAWDAEAADTEEARQTRESAAYGNYRLRCLTPPIGSHLAVEVQWVANGTNGRGRTKPLFQKTLLHGDYSVFRKFGKNEPSFLYLRGAGYWQVIAILGRADRVGVVELQRVGFSPGEIRPKPAARHVTLS